MRIQRLGLGGLALSLGLGLWACSSDDSTGTTGTAGTSTSSGGSSGSGGSGGNQGTSGTQGTGGQGTSGSNGGSGGSSVAGSSGSGGSSVTDGGGSSDAAGSSDATGAVEAGPFTITSTAYTEGMTIPAVHTCAGANTSPPLAWSGAPATTKSFALVFTDKDNNAAAGGFIHWVLWDIPPATMSLPAALPAGMPAGSKGSSIGNGGAYAGPCPGANVHNYIFELYPLDVATLPNVMASTSRPNLVTAIKMHQLVPPAHLTGSAKTQ
jgi:Raf kinase inhibitor-like YbhB/YbcL family protein